MTCLGISSLFTSSKPRIFRWFLKEGQKRRLQAQDQEQYNTSWFALCPRQCCLLTPSPRAPGETHPVGPPAWAGKTGSPHQAWKKPLNSRRSRSFGDSNQSAGSTPATHSLQKHCLLLLHSAFRIRPSSPLRPGKWKERRNVGHSPHLCLWSWPGGPWGCPHHRAEGHRWLLPHFQLLSLMVGTWQS